MAREQFMVEIEFILSTAAKAEFQVLGYWLRLVSFSSARILGGRLKDAKAWSDGVAIRTVGLPRQALDDVAASELGAWDGEDLVLYGYDLEGERLWKKQSKGGKEGNRLRWSNRTPTPPPTTETDPATDVGTGSDTESGDRIRESESESESESDDESGSDSRARADDRIAAAAAAGGFQVDPKTAEVLRKSWLKVTKGLTVEEIRDLFANGRRLTGHEIRYPHGFTKARIAQQAERNAAQAKIDQATARAESEERQAAKQAELDIEATRCARVMDAVETWFELEPTGETTLVAIMANPEHRKRLERARTDRGQGLWLFNLGKAFPELAAIVKANQ